VVRDVKERRVGWIWVSAGFGFLAVALGAFGAHGLRGKIPERLFAAYETGVLYHLVHAVVLLAVSLAARQSASTAIVAQSLLVAGIVLFSGSLYVMAMTGYGRLGIVTPFGGVCLLAAWVAIGVQLGR